MIRAYPSAPAVASGETLELCASGNRRFFSTRFVRCGKANETLWCDGERLPLVAAAPGEPGVPWDWPAYRFEVAKDWRPGAYVAIFLEEDGDSAQRAVDASLDARSNRALFVVRPRSPQAALLVVLPLFTYHAYNVAHVDGTSREGEGDCLYSGAQWVTVQRPGGGTGGHPWDEVNADAYDRGSPRQTFTHWDLKALAWLETHGYAYDVCTDVELHDGTVPLEPYHAVTSFGHHEYWTPQMRARLGRYLNSGGNVAFFGGNTMWFRAQFDRQRRAIRRDGKWNDEWKTTGVTYACGGGRWIGERAQTPLRVVFASHEFLAGTGLRDGDRFGGDAHVVGYECDGKPASSDLTLLAEASLHDWPLRDACGERAVDGRASLGVRPHGRGSVFTASTTDWARAMQTDGIVSRITQNVLNAFGAERISSRRR